MPVAPGLKEKLAQATQNQIAARGNTGAPTMGTSNGINSQTSPGMLAPKAPPQYTPPKIPSQQPVQQPTTNYGGTGNPLNEILYSKEQYDAGNKNWASNNAQQFYAKLGTEEAAKVQGMNTQQLRDYINSKNSGPAGAGAGASGGGQSGGGGGGVPAGGGYSAPVGGSAGFTPPIQSAPPKPYESTYKGPDLTGMTKNIEDTYANRLAAELQKIREARDTALQGYNLQETAATQGAYDARNQSDVVNMQGAQAMKETMANAGLTTDGQNLTLQAGQNAARLGDLGLINRQETTAKTNIAEQRAGLQNNAAGNELALQQQIDSDKAAALLDLQKYGDTRNFDVDQANYGRYRDDVSQQFAQDQFDYGQYQDDVQNQAQYGGVYKGNKTVQQQQQDIQNQAQYQGTYGGQKTVDQQQRDFDNGQTTWQNKFAYGQAIGQFGNGQQTVEKQRMMSDLTGKMPDGSKTSQQQQQDLSNMWQQADLTGTIPDKLAEMYGLPKGTKTQSAAQWAAENVLAQDGRDLDWIKEDFDQQDAMYDNTSDPAKYSGMSAGQVTSALKSQLFDSSGRPKRDVNGNDIVTKPEDIYGMVLDYGLPEGQDDQVMMSLGLTAKQIADFDKMTGHVPGK